MTKSRHYCIARHTIRIVFQEGLDIHSIIPSLKPFEIKDCDSEAMLTMEISSETASAGNEMRIVREADTGNGVIRVMKAKEDNDYEQYRFEINDTSGVLCSTLTCSYDFSRCRCHLTDDAKRQQFGLNSALMLAYAFSASDKGTLLIHASLVRHQGKAYAFVAKSGTGKSTQTSNWLKYIPGCDLMNDDNPIIRVTEDGVIAYGSPWSGKTPCYRQVEAPLKSIAQIKRAESNYIEPLKPLEAFTTLLCACSTMKWDETIYRNCYKTVSRIVERITMFNLHCLPDGESALVAKKGMSAE